MATVLGDQFAYEFIGFGAIDGDFAYDLIGFAPWMAIFHNMNS